jgi:hypothetical protein
MRKRSIRLTFLLLLILTYADTFAQGISRSNGIGLRIGSWNITNHPTRISTSGYGKDGSVDIGGAGAWFYYFSRLHNNLFLELSLGAVGGVHEEHSNYIVESTEATAIVPFLLGFRYDLLSPKIPSSLLPYFSFGGGPYWITKVQTNNQYAFQDEAIIESGQETGAYLGLGTNLLIASWLGLNFDMKYHFIDFEFEKGYSGLEMGMGLCIMWGRKREMFQIKEIRLLVKDVYPAYYQFYNSYPIALVSVKNLSSYPIEVKVKSVVRPYSERPKDSEYVRIEPGKTKDIPVTAIFGKNLQTLSQREPAILDMEVEARAGRVFSKTISERITLHSRNAWNGEMDKLNFFVTADNEDVLTLSRNIIARERLNAISDLNNFEKAKLIFNELKRMDIHYFNDPNIIFYKDDRVQFASETLRLKNGDCDDLVVLFASMLESIGINTAFVEVRDPEKEIAHLYLLFDSNLEPIDGYAISSNEKRYVVREKMNNKQSIWIPIETTLIDRGFDHAWQLGATNYLKEGILRKGIDDGWMRIIDVE